MDSLGGIDPTFVICRLCHVKPGNGVKFYINSPCKDVFCRDCMRKTDQGKRCPVHNAPIEKFAELNQNLNQRVKNFFSAEYVQKLHKDYEEMQEFQYQQAMIEMEFLYAQEDEFLKLSEELEAKKKEFEAVEAKHDEVRAVRRALQERLRQLMEEEGDVTVDSGLASISFQSEELRQQSFGETESSFGVFRPQGAEQKAFGTQKTSTPSGSKPFASPSFSYKSNESVSESKKFKNM